jgi:hypothetical protein
LFFYQHKYYNNTLIINFDINFIDMSTTRSGEMVSPQIGKIGVVTGLDSGNFKIEGVPFNIKNDGEAAVELEVNLWGMKPGEFVKTRFEVGWNPEIVREIKQMNINATLIWGY